MNHMTKLQLPLLAAAALLVSACDPFPAAPAGAPAVVRAIASGTDLLVVEGADVADPAAITVSPTSPDAVLYVQFNKPMDGTTIQAMGNYDENYDPRPVTQICRMFAGTGASEPGSPLTFSANWPAGSLVCYLPSSVDEGGQIQVTPGDLLATGSYTMSGTVKDYQGTPLAIGVTFVVP